MNLQLVLRRPEECSDDLRQILTRAERLLTLTMGDGQTVLTLSEGPSAATGHTVQRVAWALTDGERAALIGALAADDPAEAMAAALGESFSDPGQGAEFLEVGEHPLIRSNALAAHVLDCAITYRGAEFSQPRLIVMADRLVDEGLTYRQTDSAGVVTYHPTPVGRAAHKADEAQRETL